MNVSLNNIGVEEWRSKVYKIERETGLIPLEWRRIRDDVLTRDRFTCQRCDKRFSRKKDLSVHHLIPRSKGGSNDLTNLTTLCNPCHDYVEIMDFSTLAEIMGSYDDLDIDENDEVEEDKPDSYNRPEWHKYVYGGKRGSR